MPSAKKPNRAPISDCDFSIVSDHFGYDGSLPLESVTIGSWPHRNPYVIEKVEFGSIHGERVPAFFTHPKDSTKAPHPAILLLHGMNSFWGKNEDWALEWMDILSREGWCVLVADFYGFGERMRVGQEPAWENYSYAGRDALIQSVTDQRRGLDYLLARPEVDSARTVLMGGSMGGYFGVIVAGLEPRFAAVVLTVTGAWPDEQGTDDPFGRFGHTLNFAPRLSAPLLLVNATGDGRESGEELYNAMPDPKRQIWYESNHYLPPREYNEDILAWLHEKLD
ncbi:MAG: alpha/beta fold hydrolase [Candidatus Latescibacteria bacterium]|nr:alpha/beta fold hydrolase [Candidatus Latescibacterota bacterium]